eukprot:1359075-Rhodomonas_salina.1
MDRARACELPPLKRLLCLRTSDLGCRHKESSSDGAIHNGAVVRRPQHGGAGGADGGREGDCVQEGHPRSPGAAGCVRCGRLWRFRTHRKTRSCTEPAIMARRLLMSV